MSERIYIVTPEDDDCDPRLVRAGNRAQVARHIVQPYTIEVASQDDLVVALSKGVKVEDAKDEAE